MLQVCTCNTLNGNVGCPMHGVPLTTETICTPNPEVTYTVGFLTDSQREQIKKDLLLELTMYTDPKIDNFIKTETEKNRLFKEEQLKHMAVVEKYLEMFIRLVEKMK